MHAVGLDAGAREWADPLDRNYTIRVAVTLPGGHFERWRPNICGVRLLIDLKWPVGPKAVVPAANLV